MQNDGWDITLQHLRGPGDIPPSAPTPGSDPRCWICGGTTQVQLMPKWLVGLGETWCFHCFEAWYDYGKTDVDEIRAKSLWIQAKTDQNRELSGE